MRPLQQALQPRRHVSRALLLPLLMMGGMAGVGLAAERHLALVRSEPANAAVVGKSPKAITLWFSQRPNVKLTRLVLTHTKRDTIKTETPVAVDSAGKQISVVIDSVLPPGTYAVNWRTLARDGHAVAGRFTFTIAARGVVSGSSSTAPLFVRR